MRYFISFVAGCLFFIFGLEVGRGRQYFGAKFELDQCTTFETGLQQTQPRYVEDQNQQKLYTFVDVTAKQTVTICQKTEWK